MKHMKDENGLLWLAVAACFALGALLGWREIGSPDIGFHLSSARWMLEHRAWPSTDAFTFTVSGHPYIDLQWLFQLLLYGANHLGGAAFMIAFKIAITLVCWGLLVARARRVTGTLPWSVPLLLLLVALGDYFEERPHIFSWVYGSLILLILEEFARGNRRWLPALPVIMLCWVNTHQLFVLGLVMIGVHAAWELRKGTSADRRLLLCALVSVAACVINPYGLRGVLFPLTLFGEIQSGHVFAGAAAGITELQPPFSLSLYFLAGRFVLFQPPLYWHLYTALALVGLVGAWRSARVPDLVLWALFAYVFSMAHKNFGYFVMATFPLAATGVDQALFWVRRPRALLWIPLALAVVLVPLTVSGTLSQLAWADARIRAGYSSRFLPVEASEFLKDHQIEGKVLTTFGNGAYVHWISKLPVSIYSLEEVLGPEFYDEVHRVIGAAGLSRVSQSLPADDRRRVHRGGAVLGVLPERAAVVAPRPVQRQLRRLPARVGGRSAGAAGLQARRRLRHAHPRRDEARDHRGVGPAGHDRARVVPGQRGAPAIEDQVIDDVHVHGAAGRVCEHRYGRPGGESHPRDGAVARARQRVQCARRLRIG